VEKGANAGAGLMMKVALVHDWLTGMRGGERCLETFCELFPQADLFTLLYLPGTVSSIIAQRRITTSFIQRLPMAKQRYRYYLPLFPAAIERLNVQDYDLVISSSHCVAKGVRVPTGGYHLSYVYTPMRYIWDQYETYFAREKAGLLTRALMRTMRPRLQTWDVISSRRVSQFVAISDHVAQRVRNTYGRQATVVYPPVNWQSFQVSMEHEGYYLVVTAFAPYKRVDVAIDAANQLGFRLKIIGSGQDEARLIRMAGPTVEFLGWQPDEVVREHYARCRALLFPGEEDFGIVPLEAMACGKPVIAYGKGGALETVVPLNPRPRGGGAEEAGSLCCAGTPTGVFFYEQTVASLREAIEIFERNQSIFDPKAIREHVEPFDRDHFKRRIQRVIHQAYAGHVTRHVQAPL
jgi:glycosyltransferase involved in cell wall biosynthesis